MSIKRYDMVTKYRGHNSWNEIEEGEDGLYVTYEDHASEVARLNEQVRALAVAYERMTNVLLNEGIQVADPKPAEVDAILNEVRAQEVDGFSLWVEKNGHAAATETDLPVKKISDACVKLASIYAEIIRKGESQ